jgi:hypothetical protein
LRGQFSDGSFWAALAEVPGLAAHGRRGRRQQGGGHQRLAQEGALRE